MKKEEILDRVSKTAAYYRIDPSRVEENDELVGDPIPDDIPSFHGARECLIIVMTTLDGEKFAIMPTNADYQTILGFFKNGVLADAKVYREYVDD